MNKILVPFPKYENIDFYLEHEIDGFIMGIKNYSENFNNLVESKKIEKYCKHVLEKNKELYISLNKSYYNSEMESLKKLLVFLDKLNITGVIFIDLSILNIIKENNLNLNPIFDGKHLSTNSKTINFLEKRGVNGVFLSNEITTEEKINILNKINVKVYIALFGFTNVAISSRKLISNYFKYCNIDRSVKDYYYIKEKTKDDLYPIMERDNTSFYSSKIFNGIIEFSKIMKNGGSDYIFLNDYKIEDSSFYNVIEAFIAARNFPDDEEFINKLSKVVESNCFNKTDEGFSNKETIFKVKNYE